MKIIISRENRALCLFYISTITHFRLFISIIFSGLASLNKECFRLKTCWNNKGLDNSDFLIPFFLNFLYQLI
jgi:hypothetical protein